MADPPILTPAEVERRVRAYLRAKDSPTRQQWRELGPRGMRLLYTLAVTSGEDDGEHRLRAQALATLGQLGGSVGIQPLVDAITEEGVPVVVRCGAIEGLGHVATARAVPVLQSQAYFPDFKVRLYAVSALASIATAASRRILEDVALRDPHSQVKRSAQVELNRMDTKSEDES
ncbi:MAG: hypothetical protein CL928_18680 [Deltaproteobacteria bacterium]|nr:hypothetical protein [Deltaproteobacteria bacterium]